MPNIIATWLASFLACFPYFEEMKVGYQIILLSVCLHVYLTNNFWTPAPIYMELVMYAMAPESISMAQSINPTHQ
jgi:hypothetical protein